MPYFISNTHRITFVPQTFNKIFGDEFKDPPELKNEKLVEHQEDQLQNDRRPPDEQRSMDYSRRSQKNKFHTYIENKQIPNQSPQDIIKSFVDNSYNKGILIKKELQTQNIYLQRLLNEYLHCQLKSNNQIAFAVLIMSDEYKVVGPYKCDRHKHSEDYIIDEINKYEKPILEIYLYTTNNPCLVRKYEPCMSKLIEQKDIQHKNLCQIKHANQMIRCGDSQVNGKKPKGRQTEHRKIPMKIFFRFPYFFPTKMDKYINEDEISDEFKLKFDFELLENINEKIGKNKIEKSCLKKFMNTVRKIIIYDEKLDQQSKTYKYWKEYGSKIPNETLELNLTKKPILHDLFQKWWNSTLNNSFSAHRVFPELRKLEYFNKHIQFFKIEYDQSNGFTIYG